MNEPTTEQILEFAAKILGKQAIASVYSQIGFVNPFIEGAVDRFETSLLNSDHPACPIFMHLGQQVVDKRKLLHKIETDFFGGYWACVQIPQRVNMATVKDDNKFRAFWTAFYKATEGKT